MKLKKEPLQDKVNQLFAETFIQSDAKEVPTIDDSRLTHGTTGLEGEFTFLYVDIRRSSNLSSSHKRQTIAKIYKAFHHCMVEAIKNGKGKVRSFDGDRVMGVFAGDRKVNNAVETAMLMVGCKRDILTPQIKSFYKNESFDIGIGIATGETLVVKAGQGYDKNNRELVWIGDAPNLGAKLSDSAKHPRNIYICETSFNRLFELNRWHTDEIGVKHDMWRKNIISFGGNNISVYSCNWLRGLS